MTNAEIKAGEELTLQRILAMFESVFKLFVCWMFDYVFRVLAALHERRHRKTCNNICSFVVPVSSSKPTLATHQNPNFCPSDTTFWQSELLNR
jgi:hypothetical protein